MKLQATEAVRPHVSRSNLLDYIALGYVPSDKTNKATSLTLEYAYDDWAVGILAQMLGYTDDATLFLGK